LKSRAPVTRVEQRSACPHEQQTSIHDQPSSGAEDDEELAALDGVAGADVDRLDGALGFGADLVLHLHRLEDEQRLSGCDAGAGGHGDADHLARDRRADFLRPAGGRSALRDLALERVAEVHLELALADRDAVAPRRRTLPGDYEAAPVDGERWRLDGRRQAQGRFPR